MQVGRNDILRAERLGKVFHIVGAPLVQPTSAHDALHIVGTAREHDAYRPHLVLADLAGKSCGFQPMLDRLRTGMDTVRIFDEPTVQVGSFLVGVRRFDLAFDVGGRSAVGSAGLLHMEYDIAHSHVVLSGWRVRGVQRGEAPLPYWGIFSVSKTCGSENSLISYAFCKKARARSGRVVDDDAVVMPVGRRNLRERSDDPKACAPVRPEGSSRNPIGRTRGGRAEPLRLDFSFHRARLYLAE